MDNGEENQIENQLSDLNKNLIEFDLNQFIVDPLQFDLDLDIIS